MVSTTKFKKNGSKKFSALKVCLEKLIIKLKYDEAPLFENPSLLNYYYPKDNFWTLSFCLNFYNLLQRGDISCYDLVYSHRDYNVTKLRELIIKNQKELSDDVLFDYRNLLSFGFKLCELSQFFSDWIIHMFLKQQSSYAKAMLDEKSLVQELENELSEITKGSGTSKHIEMLLNFFTIWEKSSSQQDGGLYE